MRAVFVMLLLILFAPFSIANADINSSWAASTEWYENDLILDGDGVVIAIADTGVDVDHSCFRENLTSVGTFSQNHRKIIHYNDSIDSGDFQGHTQFKHGTHLAGILACDPIDGDNEMRSLSFNSKLLIQDVVGADGWDVPSVNLLLEEAFENGALISSWSWGDNTINYTNRSNIVDSWSLENPWSLVFVAPGNNGGMLLEPANARNVVAVSACDSQENGSVWSSSSIGPDVNGRRGIFVCAPGYQVTSARADGVINSMNNGSYELTGTSVSTPMAASFTALLQQMIQERDGFVPSGPLLKAVLALSTEKITSNKPDFQQGFGRLSVEEIDPEVLIYDSYQNENWSEVISTRGKSLENLVSNPWNGSGSKGPFLQEGESFSLPIIPNKNQDVTIAMSYNALPMHNGEIDDLRLIVHKPNGEYYIDDSLLSSGNSTSYYSSFISPYDHDSSNETTVIIKIPAGDLVGVDSLDVEVYASNITKGENEGFLGINGDMVGFALAITGAKEAVENTPPFPTINLENNVSNFTQIIDFEWTISDLENDDFTFYLFLENESMEIQLDSGTIINSVYTEKGDILFNNFCEVSTIISENSNITYGDCTINLSLDLITYQLNGENWSLKIEVVDHNNSWWTSNLNSTASSSNFSIWWINPLLENNDDSVNYPVDDSNDSNKSFILGVVFVILGVLFAASMAFRKFENLYLESPPAPFIEEE